MTTSGETTALMTVGDLIRDAMTEIGVLPVNASPTARQLAFGMRRLNYMLKDWQGDGVNLWRQEDVEIDWPADTPEGDISPDINDILSLRYVTTFDRELVRWELGQYVTLPSKATNGTPTVYCLSRGLLGLRMRLWQVPLLATTLLATINRVIEDVTDESETVDVPQQFTRTVMMNLAADLVPAYSRATDPNAVLTVRKAAQLYQIMRAADRPASYILAPAGGRYYG